MKKIIKNKKGFSMAEVVISASVLIIMTVSIFFALSNSLNHSMDSRNHIIASELAQEGIELVRNVRDNDKNFNHFSSSTNCKIDKNYISGNNISCASGNTFQLKYNTTTKFYEHTAGDETKFYRRIIIAYYPDGSGSSTATGRTITSVVSWNGSNFSGTPTSTTCNVNKKCVYVSAILTER